MNHQAILITLFVLSAVLEIDRWLLCHSDFIGTVTNPLTGAVRMLSW